jgi:hypothetical protein
MLTDFPLGTWMSTSLLDLIGGRRSRTASRRLLTFGVVAAAPTVVTGLADYLSASDRQRRVAVVHAAVNTTALALYTGSLIARRRDRHAPAWPSAWPAASPPRPVASSEGTCHSPPTPTCGRRERRWTARCERAGASKRASASFEPSVSILSGFPTRGAPRYVDGLAGRDPQASQS